MVRVLIVDDVDEVRFLMRASLARDGDIAVVGEAGDGQAAVEAAQEHTPDVIVLDLAMPVMDGFEAIPEIHKVSPLSRILVVSAHEANYAADRAISLCAYDYMEKGVRLTTELAARIEAIFHGPPKCAA